MHFTIKIELHIFHCTRNVEINANSDMRRVLKQPDRLCRSSLPSFNYEKTEHCKKHSSDAASDPNNPNRRVPDSPSRGALRWVHTAVRIRLNSPCSASLPTNNDSVREAIRAVKSSALSVSKTAPAPSLKTSARIWQTMWVPTVTSNRRLSGHNELSSTNPPQADATAWARRALDPSSQGNLVVRQCTGHCLQP